MSYLKLCATEGCDNKALFNSPLCYQCFKDMCTPDQHLADIPKPSPLTKSAADQWVACKGTEKMIDDQQKRLFCKWFNREYHVTISFDGDTPVAPPDGVRSQGRSVALCAAVAWAAWQESKKH